ncbi:hypothetical protein Tco_0351684 [Tanacetum coccineum]
MTCEDWTAPRRNRVNNEADPAFTAAVAQAVADLLPTLTARLHDCEVFGHYVGKCDKRPRTEEEIEMVKKKKEQTKESMTDRDGFRDVMRKNRNVQSNTFNNSFNKYQRKPSVVQNTTVNQWKPPDICSDCEVFGHYVGKCDKRPRTEEEIEMVKKKKEQTKEV